MKILHKVHPIEVKRAFVTAQKMRFSRGKGKKYLPKLSQISFLKKLNQAKSGVSKLTEERLDVIIGKEYQKRADAYNDADWYRAKASVDEIGVWGRAGGLPASWTCCSLKQTINFVKVGLQRNSKRIRARSKRAIPRMQEHAKIISREKVLFPIVFKGGTGTCGRKRCRRKMTGDIDDGCMRSIALALSGYRILDIYFGKPKKKRTLFV